MGESKNTFVTSDAEKQASDDSTYNVGDVQRGSVHAVMMDAELNDKRYEKTQRGLKSRHAQMIALGGTIGKSFSQSVAVPCNRAVASCQTIGDQVY